MKRTTLVAAALLMTLAACGRKAEDATAERASDASPAVAPVTAPHFVIGLAAGDRFEIESSELALKRSKNRHVQDYARMMIAAHAKTTTELRDAVAAAGLAVTFPMFLLPEAADEMANLRATTIGEFDREYMDAQINAHEAALDLMTRYSERGDNAVLREAAAKAIPLTQDHLDKARTLHDTLD